MEKPMSTYVEEIPAAAVCAGDWIKTTGRPSPMLVLGNLRQRTADGRRGRRARPWAATVQTDDGPMDLYIGETVILCRPPA
jgi:hypothetical protein